MSSQITISQPHPGESTGRSYREPVQDFESIQPKDYSKNNQAPLSWRLLFTFANRQHATILIWAIVTTVIAGLLKPVQAILIGNIFTEFTSYGSDNSSHRDMLHRVSISCIFLTALGVLAWVLEGIFLSAWMVFGEAQAEQIRRNMFEALLDRDLEWYDSQKDGIPSLVTRIQTYA